MTDDRDHQQSPSDPGSEKTPEQRDREIAEEVRRRRAQEASWPSVD